MYLDSLQEDVYKIDWSRKLSFISKGGNGYIYDYMTSYKRVGFALKEVMNFDLNHMTARCKLYRSMILLATSQDF